MMLIVNIVNIVEFLMFVFDVCGCFECSIDGSIGLNSVLIARSVGNNNCC